MRQPTPLQVVASTLGVKADTLRSRLFYHGVKKVGGLTVKRIAQLVVQKAARMPETKAQLSKLDALLSGQPTPAKARGNAKANGHATEIKTESRPDLVPVLQAKLKSMGGSLERAQEIARARIAADDYDEYELSVLYAWLAFVGRLRKKKSAPAPTRD